MNLSTLRHGFLAFAFVTLAACGKGSSGTGSGAACKTAGDCGSGELCVTLGTDSTCTLDCTANANACGGSASCAGVGSVGVSVCQPAQPAPTPSNPPTPAKQPKLSCTTDQECATIHAGSVCGEWMGEHDCTIVCTQDAQCNPPAVGGVSIDFLSCQPDQGTAGRTVCLPRQECLTNPDSCITFPGQPTGTGGLPGSGGLPGF